MIKEVKDVLETVIRERIPDAVIARSVKEESQAFMARKHPIIALITAPGRFDDRTARTNRYADETTGTWKERYVRGSRIVPIQLHCWEEGEEATDKVFSRILPAIPRKWEYDGFEGSILINYEEHSDCTDSMNKVYLSIAEIQFTVDVATEEEEVPTIDTVEPETEIKQL
jgi:hypothetical protein